MFRILTFKTDRAFWPVAEPSAGAAADRQRGLFGRVMAVISGELEARRAARSLASMDERMLRDIGIDRDQIWYAARHGRELRRPIARRADDSRWS